MLRTVTRVVLAAIALALSAGPAAAQAKKPATPAEAATRTPGTYAHFVTNMGEFTVKLEPENAPNTVKNFIGLAEGTIDPRSGKPGKFKPFYNGLTFHRIIDKFMIQGGDPTGTGRGRHGYAIKDEIDKTRKFDRPGLMAMANYGPNTAGSQFFITVAPYRLAPDYTIFGHVVEGLDVVQAIGRVKTDPNDKPYRPVVMKTVTIERVK